LLIEYTQERRITVAAALSHPYVDEGRLRYHTCMCNCCPNLPDGVRYTTDAEPVCSAPFHYVFEDELNSVSRVKGSCSVLLMLCVTICCTLTSSCFTVRRYALHGICYRNSVCLSVCHTRALCPHGSTYDHDFFTAG